VLKSSLNMSDATHFMLKYQEITGVHPGALGWCGFDRATPWNGRVEQLRREAAKSRLGQP
jgi:hypothetical protein